MPPRRQKKLKTKPATIGRKLKVKNLTAPKSENLEPINQPPAVEIKFNGDKTEQKNRLIMWIGISCIMVAFFVIWIFNLKHEFSASSASADKSSPGKFDWVQIRAELDKTMQQVKGSIAEIKQIQQTATSTSPQELELTAEQINLLKEKLLNETASTTMASSTKK